MLDYFGNRKIALCRELTKIHEQVINTTLEDAIKMYIRVIPYLDKAFNTFNSALKNNVKVHPPIESEVLGCQIATDNK